MLTCFVAIVCDVYGALDSCNSTYKNTSKTDTRLQNTTARRQTLFPLFWVLGVEQGVVFCCKRDEEDVGLGADRKHDHNLAKLRAPRLDVVVLVSLQLR